MRHKHTLATIVASIALSIAACAPRDRTSAQGREANERQPVIVQGAMDIEVRKLAGVLENASEERVQGWTFWRGTIDGYPVVISKTLKGLANAAAATALAAERYHPVAVINEGTAGGHQADLHVYDIVLGIEAVNLGSFKTEYRPHGVGSDFAEWRPLDLMRSEGSAGQDPNARLLRRYHGDTGLLAAARAARGDYRTGRVVEGVIGSSEIWNSELDRIQYFHDQFGTTVEEMETAAAAQIAGLFQLPFLGIRIVSNNITNGGAYEAGTGEACQEFVVHVLRAYIREQLKPGTTAKSAP